MVLNHIKTNYIYCNNKCCVLKQVPYYNNKIISVSRRRRKKAGVFIYDSNNTKVLLVQSRGNLWGPPKGTKKYLETNKDCAIREVREETGLYINPMDDIFNIEIYIRNRAIYYFKNMRECNVNIQTHLNNNDVNGIGWIKIGCLYELICEGKMLVNQHCRIIFNNIFNIKLPVTLENKLNYIPLDLIESDYIDNTITQPLMKILNI